MNRDQKVSVTLEAESTPQPLDLDVRDDTPFRIAILADLGGGGGRPYRPRPVLIDRDEYDAVLRRIAPTISLGLEHEGEPVVVRVRDVDEFHPDHLRATLPVFETLRELRSRLDDPRTFEAAARELLGEEPAEAGSAGEVGAGEPAAGAPGPRSGSLLDMVVDAVEGPPPSGTPTARRTAPRDDLHEYIRSVVAPHIVPGEDVRKAPLTERVDAAVGPLMRRILHDPAFRSVEAAWRALFLLVRAIETGPELKLYVIDTSRTDLESDLAPSRELEKTELYRVLVEEAAGTAGSEPWSLLIGDYTFGPSAADVQLLGRIAELAQRAGAPFIAGGDPALAGCSGFEETPDPADWQAVEYPEWNSFRRSAGARSLGLALPRFVLRLPYGEDGDECDTFAFEELDEAGTHEQYLWGNPAFACAVMLAESFAHAGWGMRPGMHQDLNGLPLHITRRDGEAFAKPCAESLMTDRAAARLMQLGLMPLASMKERDSVRLVRFQSVADPPAALAGRWRAAG